MIRSTAALLVVLLVGVTSAAPTDKPPMQGLLGIVSAIPEKLRPTKVESVLKEEQRNEFIDSNLIGRGINIRAEASDVLRGSVIVSTTYSNGDCWKGTITMDTAGVGKGGSFLVKGTVTGLRVKWKRVGQQVVRQFDLNITGERRRGF